MVIFKFIAPILILLITALQVILDYKWHDKRTKLHRRTRKALLYILVITAVVTLVIVVGDTIIANNMQNQLIGLQDTLNKEHLEATKHEDEAKKERATLLNRLNELHFESVLNDTYRPLDARVYKVALNSIKTFLNEEIGKNVNISIECESGNRNRQLLAQEFTKLLEDAGANVQGPKFQVTFSNAVLPSIRININPDDEQLARQFVSAISPMFRTKFSGIKDDKIVVGCLRVSFFGEPVFYPDGSAGFK